MSKMKTEQSEFTAGWLYYYICVQHECHTRHTEIRINLRQSFCTVAPCEAYSNHKSHVIKQVLGTVISIRDFDHMHSDRSDLQYCMAAQA
jgi:hypothetical protein